jgi:hypothetical protein
MLENETPYLDKPEILEYPNSTWAAQDLRKACIFNAAAKYNKDKANEYLSKAAFFYHYTNQQLKEDETNSYTRILSLLMQNISAYPAQEPVKGDIYENPRPYRQTQKSNNKRGLQTLLSTAKKTTLKAELNWLQKRLPWRIKLSTLRDN